jgi:hypothetical protein
MPPRIHELLLDPWRSLSIYPRAAALRPTQALGLLLLVMLVCGGLATGKWTLRRAGQLEDIRESQLWLMPRVTVRDGLAHLEGGNGRLLDAVHFLVWLDVSTNTAEDVPLEPGELRPVVHVGREALIVHRPGMAPEPLAWEGLNERYPDLTLDGTEVADFLAAELPGRALDRLALGLALAVFWQLALLVIFSWLYRVLFYRGLYVPRFKTLLTVGAVAAIPPVVVATVALLLGAGQGPMLTIHALGLGLLFLLGATRVRLGDERPDRGAATGAATSQPDPDALPAMPAMATAPEGEAKADADEAAPEAPEPSSD